MKRKRFFIASVVFAIVPFAIFYPVMYLISFANLGGISILVASNVWNAICLALFMPFIVRRMNDIGMSVWWSLFFWLAILFNFNNFLIASYVFGISIDLVSVPVIINLIISSIIFLILLFAKGDPNKRYRSGPVPYTNHMH